MNEEPSLVAFLIVALMILILAYVGYHIGWGKGRAEAFGAANAMMRAFPNSEYFVYCESKSGCGVIPWNKLNDSGVCTS